MSPGANDGPRNTGALPKKTKSNRRSDRNRERFAANQQMANHSAHYVRTQQHSNNLLDWQPVNETESLRITKNSNTRSISSLPSSSSQEISDFASHSSGRHCNYSVEDYTPWQKMVPPTDFQTQSPPRVQGNKPSNVDKMPDRNQVESRLNQIRDYIRVTSTMMDSLNQSSDPRAQAQSEKLNKMVEDLRDSETKLANLLERYRDSDFTSQNGDSGKEDGEENGFVSRERNLRRRMEESERQLQELQEHQANLIGMQMRVRERLNEAREAQQVLLEQENQASRTSSWEGSNRNGAQLPTNVEQLESETAVLRGKLAQLQNKKKHMDHLVAELQAVEMSDRASCSSEGSRNVTRDKAAELEAMKEQLQHLKALMDEATRMRECIDSASEPESETAEAANDGQSHEEPSAPFIPNNSTEQQCDGEDAAPGKASSSGVLPTVEEVQAFTREIKEQAALLLAVRMELQHLKQPSSSQGPSTEKKPTNNISADVQPIQTKKRQLEELVRKDQSQSSSVNRDTSGADPGSQRSSTSRISHNGQWNEQSVDGVCSENLMDIGPQTAAIESGFTGNFWGYPPPPMSQLQFGSAEYYRNLLLNSQVQQLQIMGTTIQQCCQLLWAQQRELQSMRTAINQLQLQVRHLQTPQRNNSTETQEEHSNLGRNAHHLADTMDTSLPPSSSLPNLVSLPNSSPALSHATVATSTNPQQQQQQLNNQVPPGNRANNYWDNFRSYSRQNLLSGNVKTMTDITAGPISNSTTSANTANGVTLVKDKRNREHGTDNLPLPSLMTMETQYSLNLQQQSNLQQHERENTTARNNIITNEMAQPVDNLWEEAHGPFRLPHATNDENSLHNLSSEMREVIASLIASNKRRPDYLMKVLKEIKVVSEDQRLRPRLLESLRALQDTQSSNNPLNKTADQTASDSCRSSDEDSDVGAMLGYNLENQSSLTELLSSRAGTSSSPMAQVPLIDHLEMPVSFSPDSSSIPPSTSPMKSGCNEDLAEADQSRPESFGNQHVPSNEENNSEEIQEDTVSSMGAAQAVSDEVESDREEITVKAEHEWEIDNIVDRLYHQYRH